MQVKCDFCDNFFEDTEEKCPYCSAPNNHIRRHAKDVPHTIEELKAYCEANKVPVEKMHFHIGENYKGPRAYGIYKDGEEFIVYKNKSDGSRAVRYSGKDEAYAVNELFQKMRAEFNEHKTAMVNQAANRPVKRKRSGLPFRLTFKRIVIIAVLLFLVGVFIWAAIDDSGYYKYNDQYYYNQSNTWYKYNAAKSLWEEATPPEDDMDNYFESYDFDYDYGIDNFNSSDYYDDSSWDSDDDDGFWSSSDDSYDWDDDDDWSYDDSDYDWDSGSDWDSDW